MELREHGDLHRKSQTTAELEPHGVGAIRTTEDLWAAMHHSFARQARDGRWDMYQRLEVATGLSVNPEGIIVAHVKGTSTSDEARKLAEFLRTEYRVDVEVVSGSPPAQETLAEGSCLAETYRVRLFSDDVISSGALT